MKNKMPKDSWVMIDRTEFNLEYIIIEKMYNKRGYFYVQLNKKELKERLDKYHFEYLLDCYDGLSLVSFEENIDKEESDYETYQKLMRLNNE